MDGTADPNVGGSSVDEMKREIAHRPIPFLDRAETAYEHVRETLFSAQPCQTRENLQAVDVLLARSAAVIESREAALRELGGDGQSIPERA